MRVLLPARFDVLGCAMDSSIVSQWLALEAACDLVVWGPGLDGYQADMGLHEVAEYVDADVIMMPDLHQAISGLWDEMWVGVERCSRPIAWHFADHDSAVEIRRQAWQRLRPAAVISPCAEQNLGNYFDLRDQLGTRIFTVPWGYDAVQFHPPAEDAERDIDILVAGCEEPAHVYAVRGRVKQAARSLAGEFRVLDVGHPGYWESGGFVTGRGQAQYAQLLRRARLTTTGTAFNCAIARKFWESAGCGAVGVGDLPSDEPESERFRGVMLVIDPQWSVDRIVLELRQLLGDRESCELLSAGAPAAVSGCDHQERAREYVSVLEQIAETRQRKPRPFPAPAPLLKICAAAEPEAVPDVRPNWRSIWSVGESGASRTRRVQLALDGEEEVVVIALDPDATFDVDARVLAAACAARGRIVVRGTDWSLLAAPRRALAQAVAGKRGRDGLERAIVELGYDVLDGISAYTDPASMLMRLAAEPDPAGIRRALGRALAEGRTTTAHELAGLAALGGWSEPPALDEPLPPMGAQDPECELIEDADFVRFDPTDPAPLVALARTGVAANIGVPLVCGITVADAFNRIRVALTDAGVDPASCSELALVERPLYECEIAWLAAHSAQRLLAA